MKKEKENENMKIFKVVEDMELAKFSCVIGRNINLVYNTFGKLSFSLIKHITVWSSSSALRLFKINKKVCPQEP